MMVISDHRGKAIRNVTSVPYNEDCIIRLMAQVGPLIVTVLLFYFSSRFFLQAIEINGNKTSYLALFLMPNNTNNTALQECKDPRGILSLGCKSKM